MLARGSRWVYTPTILGGNSYLSWFYDRGAIKDLAHTGTSKGLSQAINRGPIRKFLPKYANVYVTIQSHDLSAGVRTHYVTANMVRNRLKHMETTWLSINSKSKVSYLLSRILESMVWIIQKCHWYLNMWSAIEK